MPELPRPDSKQRNPIRACREASCALLLRFIRVYPRLNFQGLERENAPECGALSFCSFAAKSSEINDRAFDDFPRETAAVEFVHEGIGILLFHVEDALSFPNAAHHEFGTDHGGHAGGVGDGL